jgi:nicotinate-nucleotide--dimethylbenzimidazole phosphoribosyltransferase
MDRDPLDRPEDQIADEIAALAAGIEPASELHAAAVRTAGDAPASGTAELAALAGRLAGAQHATVPAVARRCVLLCAADHGVSAGREVHVDDALGLLAAGEAPTRTLLRELTGGRSALRAAAHAAGATLVVVDCGMRGETAPGAGADLRELDHDGFISIDVSIGPGTADIRRGPAMSRVEAALSVRTGMALLVSLAENGLDVIALGHAGVGAAVASSAVIAALAGAPDLPGHPDRDAVAAALAANAVDPGDPLAVLTALGGFELGALAGMVLAAASLRIPVVLDDHGTSAAALLAARWQPAVAGYLFAAHPGTTPAHRQALHALGLTPILGQALSHGEGAGAALALPFLDTAASWTRTAGARVDALFVYGSLRSAHPAHAQVSRYVAGVAPASTAGRLVVLPCGYPGLLDDATARVTGELLQLRDVAAALDALDRYEGDEYRRVLRTVALADGSERQAWCYVAANAADGGEPIPGGDWLAWLAAT